MKLNKIDEVWNSANLRFRFVVIQKVCYHGNVTCDFSSLFRSTLVPIGRSPFLPSWKLHNVELFSAVISHLADISSWKCSWKCKSLQFEKKIGTKDSRIRTHDTDSSVHYAITSDQALLSLFFFASLFLWLEREKNNAWYIHLTSR